MKNVVNKLVVSQKGLLDFFRSSSEKRNSASGSLSGGPLNRSPSKSGYLRKSSLRPKKKGKTHQKDHAINKIKQILTSEIYANSVTCVFLSLRGVDKFRVIHNRKKLQI